MRTKKVIKKIASYIKLSFIMIWQNKKLLKLLISVILLLLIYCSFGISKIIANSNAEKFPLEKANLIATHTNYVVPLPINNDPFYSENNINSKLYKSLSNNMRNEYHAPAFIKPHNSFDTSLFNLPFAAVASHYYKSDFYRDAGSYIIHENLTIDNIDGYKHYHLNKKTTCNFFKRAIWDQDAANYASHLGEQYANKQNNTNNGPISNTVEDNVFPISSYYKDENPDTTEGYFNDFQYQDLYNHIAPESYDNMQSHIYSKYYSNKLLKYNYNWQTGRWHYQLHNENCNDDLLQNENDLRPFLNYWKNSKIINTKLYDAVDINATNKQTANSLKPARASFLVGQQNNIILPDNLPVPNFYKNTRVNLLFVIMMNPQTTKIEQIGFNLITSDHMYRTGILFDDNMNQNWTRVPLYVKASCYSNLLHFNKDHYKKLSYGQAYNEYRNQMKKQAQAKMNKKIKDNYGFWMQLKRRVAIAYDSFRYGIPW